MNCHILFEVWIYRSWYLIAEPLSGNHNGWTLGAPSNKSHVWAMSFREKERCDLYVFFHKTRCSHRAEYIASGNRERSHLKEHYTRGNFLDDWRWDEEPPGNITACNVSGTFILIPVSFFYTRSLDQANRNGS